MAHIVKGALPASVFRKRVDINTKIYKYYINYYDFRNFSVFDEEVICRERVNDLFLCLSD